MLPRIFAALALVSASSHVQSIQALSCLAGRIDAERPSQETLEPTFPVVLSEALRSVSIANIFQRVTGAERRKGHLRGAARNTRRTETGSTPPSAPRQGTHPARASSNRNREIERRLILRREPEVLRISYSTWFGSLYARQHNTVQCRLLTTTGCPGSYRGATTAR